MRQEMRRNWKIARRTDKGLTDLANMFNPTLRSWIRYYGEFHRSALTRVFRQLDEALVTWVMRKFKRYRGHRTKASKWLQEVVGRQPRLFAHWSLLWPRNTTG